MADPVGFQYTQRADGAVALSHRGRAAGTLRGPAAEQFLAEIADADPGQAQHIMARYTGNYRRGNERTARRHPRNR